MKAPYFFSCLLGFIISFAAASQSVYHFRYNFHQPGDSVTCNAFFVRYDDGTGLLRVRYTSAVTGQDILIEADMEENYIADTVSAGTDTIPFFLKASNPRFIIGNNDIKFNLPFFQFRHNPVTGFYEPSGITAAETNTTMDPHTSFEATLVERSSLNKEFVAAFFSEDEDFYINLFKTSTKGLTEVEKNIKLYLLVVADTLDKEIGHSCSLDVSRIIETFQGIATYFGIKFFPKTIAGAAYNKKNVETAISGLRPSANDIVVFYYSGHGYRKEAENRRFPNLKLKTNHKNLQDVLLNSMNIEDIFLSIKKKPARLNLVLSDCCNSDIEITNATGRKPGKIKGSGIEWNGDNCRALFLNKTPMSILATAADNGQKASSNNDFGGFFSYYFKTSMENYCSKFKSNVSWDQVLQDTKTQTIFKAKHTYCDKPYIPENICNQYPYYIIR
ncbi:MAG TPA: caspase family protein [Chitinophagaceae bacterium]|nr:caspase family protein [Chitinophagaceae bacterium]